MIRSLIISIVLALIAGVSFYRLHVLHEAGLPLEFFPMVGCVFGATFAYYAFISFLQERQ